MSNILCYDSFSDVKILDWSKFKAISDDKLDVAPMLKFVFKWVENIAGKGENAGFSFSHNVFKRILSQDRYDSGLYGKELTLYQTVRFRPDLPRMNALFVCGFTPYQQLFGNRTATVHKSTFSGLFLTST